MASAQDRRGAPPSARAQQSKLCSPGAAARAPRLCPDGVTAQVGRRGAGERVSGLGRLEPLCWVGALCVSRGAMRRPGCLGVVVALHGRSRFLPPVNRRGQGGLLIPLCFCSPHWGKNGRSWGFGRGQPGGACSRFPVVQRCSLCSGPERGAYRGALVLVLATLRDFAPPQQSFTDCRVENEPALDPFPHRSIPGHRDQ